MERLDKYLSDCGAGTRSQVKGMIKAGRVTVDGKPEKDPGRKVGAETVCLDGQPLKKQGRRVILLNKPEGFVTATEDRVERTVMELLPREYQDLKPVGRLDKATEGLLLFTDDGDLLHRLISPKKKVPKVYYARHEGTATAEDVQAFRQGLTLGDGTRCLEADLEILGPGQCHVTVYEVKYHQVRRMLASRGLPVTYLERIREGELTLGDLPRGQVRPLTDQEIENLDA